MAGQSSTTPSGSGVAQGSTQCPHCPAVVKTRCLFNHVNDKYLVVRIYICPEANCGNWHKRLGVTERHLANVHDIHLPPNTSSGGGRNGHDQNNIDDYLRNHPQCLQKIEKRDNLAGISYDDPLTCGSLVRGVKVLTTTAGPAAPTSGQTVSSSSNTPNQAGTALTGSRRTISNRPRLARQPVMPITPTHVAPDTMSDTENDRQPTTKKDANSHIGIGREVGRKTKTGAALDTGWRALNRAGAPCRRWKKKGLQLKSFTGVSWGMSTWRDPARAPVMNGDDEVEDESESESDVETGDG